MPEIEVTPDSRYCERSGSINSTHERGADIRDAATEKKIFNSHSAAEILYEEHNIERPSGGNNMNQVVRSQSQTPNRQCLLSIIITQLLKEVFIPGGRFL